MLGNLLRQFLAGRTRRARTQAASTPPAAPSSGDRLDEALRLQRLGRHGDAAEMASSVLANEPDNIDALQLAGAAFLARGETRDGLAFLRRAAALAPQSANIQATLADVLAQTGDLAGALEAYRQATLVEPGFADAWAKLAWLLKGVGRYDEAEDACRSGLASSARHGMLHHVLAGTLFEQGRTGEALIEIRAALAIDPGAAAVGSELLRMLNYAEGQDPAAIFREHVVWDERHARALGEGAPAHGNVRDAQRLLRVGFTSPWFRKHAMTFFFESFVEHHDRRRLSVFLYADVDRPDDYSRRLQCHAAVWRTTAGISDEAFARLVREDGIDILVDLSGHTQPNRLLAFARRPAPVQATWNGYPNTTGMAAMDYRVTDARCDPPGRTEMFHTETLVRLPGIYMSWRTPADAPEPGPLPALAAGRVTFGSFNACFKITSGTVEMWAAILAAVPHSRLRVFAVPGGRAASHLREQFAARGVAGERLELVPRVSHESFLAAHREVDIALDTFPYHGTTTTCFSLWMGVPVVVLVGPTHASRVGLTLLSSVGLDRLAAGERAQYVQTAVRLAQDLPALAAVREGLRARMLHSSLTDGAACARAMEEAFSTMWVSWCRSG